MRLSVCPSVRLSVCLFVRSFWLTARNCSSSFALERRLDPRWRRRKSCLRPPQLKTSSSGRGSTSAARRSWNSRQVARLISSELLCFCVFFFFFFCLGGSRALNQHNSTELASRSFHWSADAPRRKEISSESRLARSLARTGGETRMVGARGRQINKHHRQSRLLALLTAAPSADSGESRLKAELGRVRRAFVLRRRSRSIDPAI